MTTKISTGKITDDVCITTDIDFRNGTGLRMTMNLWAGMDGPALEQGRMLMMNETYTIHTKKIRSALSIWINEYDQGFDLMMFNNITRTFYDGETVKPFSV